MTETELHATPGTWAGESKLTGNTTDLQKLNFISMAIKRDMEALSSSEFGHEADPELLRKKFLLLQRKFAELTKITNAGKGPAELRAKLKILQKWAAKYADTSAAEIAAANLPKKYDSRPVVLDQTAIKKISYFKEYIGHVVNYMASLGPKYQETKELVSGVLDVGQTLNQHENKFMLTEDHIPSYDMLAADDKGRKKRKKAPEKKHPPVPGDAPSTYMHGGKAWDPDAEEAVGPTKMVTSMQTVLNQFHAYSVKVSDKYQEVLELAHELDSVNLADFFARTNQRNAFLRRLLHSLSDLNKLIYTGDLPNKGYLREQYYRIVENCVPLLPAHIASRVAATVAARKGKSPFQTVVDNAISSGYDPNKDLAQKFVSPHMPQKEVFQPKKQTMEDRVERALRLQDAALERDKYQGAKKPLLNPPRELGRNPAEVAKYREQWLQESLRDEASASHVRLMKLAKYYRRKY